MVPIISTESGMMLLRMPPLMMPDGDDRGIHRDVELAAHHGLHGIDDLRGDDDGIDALPWARAVRLLAIDHDCSRPASPP